MTINYTKNGDLSTIFFMIILTAFETIQKEHLLYIAKYVLRVYAMMCLRFLPFMHCDLVPLLTYYHIAITFSFNLCNVCMPLCV